MDMEFILAIFEGMLLAAVGIPIVFAVFLLTIFIIGAIFAGLIYLNGWKFDSNGELIKENVKKI